MTLKDLLGNKLRWDHTERFPLKLGNVEVWTDDAGEVCYFPARSQWDYPAFALALLTLEVADRRPLDSPAKKH